MTQTRQIKTVLVLVIFAIVAAGYGCSEDNQISLGPTAPVPQMQGDPDAPVCLDCHSNTAEFCDRCHDYASVRPYCWHCHNDNPKGE